MEHEDQYIIREVLAGNPSRYGVLVEKYQDMVMSIAYRVLQQHEEAEDLAQSCFVKAFEKLPTFKGAAQFSTWLYRIAYHMAISQHRKLNSTGTGSTFSLSDYEQNLADEVTVNALEREEKLAQLEKALQKLEADERTLITLYYNQQLPIHEIAEITGLSPSNVKVKLFRSRKKLAVLFQQLSQDAYYQTNAL